MKNIKLFRKSDLIIAAAVILLALILFIPSLMKKDVLIASVYVDGQLIKEINLNDTEKSFTFSPKAGTEITVENGKICFSSSVCRDSLCEKSGWLYKNGQTAACLPEKIVICIKGSDSAPDMLTY